MKGTMIGDIIGSRFERKNIKSKDFELFVDACRFTDDTTLSLALADALLHKRSYQDAVAEYAIQYQNVGYGKSFKKWIKLENKVPYNSWGNGSAMRVAPIAWWFDTESEVLEEAEKSAVITHNHPAGIKGAQVVALAIFMARKGKDKTAIKQTIEERFGYDLSRTIDSIRPTYKFDVSCQGSVPEAIIAFLEAEDFEDTIRTSISIGGDSDTIAAIAGSIAEAYYKGVPERLETKALTYLPDALKEVLEAFYVAVN